MRIGVIVFHKNNHIYDKRWIDKFVCSILEQTYSDFVIYEVDYGGGSVSVFNGYEYAQEHKFYTENFNNHAEAMNFLIDRTLEDSCDYVFNTNIDDYYEKNRFEIQLTHLLDGYDLVSSNFDYIKDDGFGNDIETLSFRYDDVDIIYDLINGNNCIAHPCVAYSRAYLLRIVILDNVYYPSEIPYEDLNLWKRTMFRSKMFICPEVLLKYRLHSNQITKTSTKIGLMVIATNKYDMFLEPLIKSADEFFLKDYEVEYFIFTNRDINIDSKRKINIIKVEHRDWPWMTLGRYRIFSNSSDILSQMSYLYYCDADMRFVGDVGDEIFGDLVATQHPGYYSRRGTPETNPASLACVNDAEEMEYFVGAFNGGKSSEYIKMAETLSNNIDIDYSKGIIAVWHDESHMNRYFIDNKPTKILNPSYCYGESMNIPFDKKLLALDKKHEIVREL